MDNNYEYKDPDYKYTDKKTGILKNKMGIQNQDVLQKYEYRLTTIMAKTIKESNMKIKDIKDIQTIHKKLFGELYEWAGQFREVEISKGTQFHPIHYFPNAINWINEHIKKYKIIKKYDKKEITKKLAELLDGINQFRGFREGNGRTQRLVIELLAQEKGYDLNLNPPDRPEVNKKYMKGTVEGNIGLLAELIWNELKIIEPIKKQKKTEKTKTNDPRYD